MPVDSGIGPRGPRRLWRAALYLLRRARWERDLDDELAAFVDQVVAEKSAAGGSPARARREALIELGGLEQTKERVRESRAGAATDRLLVDLRYAARRILRERGVTAVAVVTLAVGIGAGAAILGVARAVLWRPLPFADPERLVVIEETDATFDGGRYSVAPPNFLDWRAENRVFPASAAMAPQTYNLAGGGPAERLDGLRVSAGYFELLGLRPIAGRWFRGDEDASGGAAVVVLSEALWRRRFAADPRIVGRAVRLDGRAVEVIGVAPKDAELPGQPADVWMPLALDARERSARRSHFLAAIARLAPDVSLVAAQSDLDRIADRLRETYPQSNGAVHFRVRALRDALVGRYRADLWILLGMAVVLIVVTSANVANLLLARGVGRRREIAVRAALGADAPRIARQLLVESAWLALLGGVAGLLVGAVVLRLLIARLSFELPGLGSATLDPLTLGTTLVASVTSGLAFGAVPALRATRIDLAGMLRQSASGSGGPSKTRLRSALVSIQVGLAFVLVVASLLLVRSARRLEAAPRGFETDRRSTFELALTGERYRPHEARARALREILERVDSLPEVETAGLVSFLPLDFEGGIAGISVEGRTTANGELHRVSYRVVSGDYFRAIGIPLRRGHPFSDADAERRSAIAAIDEAAAERYFGGRDPIGARVKLGLPDSDGPWLEVVAVVGRARLFALGREPTPTLYVPFAQEHAAWVSPRALVVRSGVEPTRLAPAVVGAIAAFDPTLPVTKIRTLEQVVASSIGNERARTTVVAAFAAVALVLVFAGLYGVVSLAVAQQRRELCVRCALGARARDVVSVVARRGARLVTIGLVPGWFLALLLAHLLRRWLYGIGPLDPASHLASGALIAVMAGVACWLPARSALRVPPDAVLREP